MAIRHASSWVVLAVTALAGGNAAAQLPRDTKVLSCDSKFYQSLLDAPVTDVREDLGVALYAVDQLRELSVSQAQCEMSHEQRIALKPSLVGYLENRWIAEVLDEPIEPVATVRDAVLQQSERVRQSADSQDARAEREARRLSAYQRSLAIVVPDAIPSPDEVVIEVRNVSTWTVRLYPHNIAGGRWPTLRFRPMPESPAIPFDCLYVDYVAELESGQQTSLKCRSRPAPADQASERAALTLSGSTGSWTLHPGEELRGFSDVSRSDVSVASALVLERANAIVAKTTCKDRGSCATEAEISHRGQNDLWMVFLPIPIAFLLALALPRFSAYVLGPAIIVLAVGFAIVEHKLFAPFQSDGSPAGLLVPAIAWIALSVCCVVGAALIGTGLARIKAKKRTRSAASAMQK